MQFESESLIEESVTQSRRARRRADESETVWRRKKAGPSREEEYGPEIQADESIGSAIRASKTQPKVSQSVKTWPPLTRAHAISFVGLLLFTAVTYFRPYELIEALSGFRSMAFWLAVITLAFFVPTQLSADSTLTARPLEVIFALLLLLTGFLSVPFALEPSEAWATFIDFAKVIAMFIVLINVVRTERRWRWMIWLSLLVSVFLSFYALNDYRLGRFDIRGDRIEGVIRKGMFENPNDLAMQLVTMIPIAIGLLLIARSYSKKVFYGLLTAMMIGATVITFSRGGFLGLVISCFVLAWKFGRRNRIAVVIVFLVLAAVSLLILPSEFIGRLMSIFSGDADGGSASARQNLLLRSILVTLRHPVLGIGMGNFHNVSISEQVSHNAYTQVSAEMGVPAMIFYILFMVSAIKRMARIEHETRDTNPRPPVYYVTVGLQAALVGYMVCSFFASVAYLWYIYFLVGFALCIHRLYESKGAEGVFRRPAVRRPSSVLDESAIQFATPIRGSLISHHER